MSKVKFVYSYCDAGNFRNWSEVIFSNPTGIPLEAIEDTIRKAFVNQEFFIASQVGIPELFFGEVTVDDVSFHLLEALEYTDNDVSDSNPRTVEEFMKEVEIASAKVGR